MPEHEWALGGPRRAGSGPARRLRRNRVVQRNFAHPHPGVHARATDSSADRGADSHAASGPGDRVRRRSRTNGTVRPCRGRLQSRLPAGDERRPIPRASATISADGLYRYELTRTTGVGGPSLAVVLWVMLNPSTAGATTGDPTIRRVVAFSRASGYSLAVVVNLFALRATNPRQLIEAINPVGPATDGYIARWARRADRVVLAYGAVPRALRWRVHQVGRLLPTATSCLGTTRDGWPRHPLYVRADTTLQP